MFIHIDEFPGVHITAFRQNVCKILSTNWSFWEIYAKAIVGVEYFETQCCTVVHSSIVCFVSYVVA